VGATVPGGNAQIGFESNREGDFETKCAGHPRLPPARFAVHCSQGAAESASRRDWSTPIR